MRVFLPALALALTGCGLVLGLDEFSDAPSSGSMTTSSDGSGGASTSAGIGGADTTTTGSGGSGAAGGSGGAPMSTCSPVGQPFDIVSAADAAGAALDGKSLLTVENPQDASVYVAVSETSTGTLFLRIVGDDPVTPIKDSAVFTPQPGEEGSYSAGRLQNGKLAFYGTGAKDIVKLEFDAPGGATLGAATFAPLTSLSCNANELARHLAVTFDGQGRMLYAATTMASETLPTQATLCYGTETTGPTVLHAGTVDANTGLELLARHLSVAGQMLLLQTGESGPGPIWFAYGTTATELDQRHPFNLTAKNDELSVAIGQLTTPAADATLLVGATVTTPAITPAGLWTGVVGVGSYGDLDATKGNVPPKELEQVITMNSTDEFAIVRQFSSDATRIFTANTTFTQESVLLDELSWTGDVKVASALVYQAPQGTSVTGAVAGIVGGPQVLVAWVEETAGPTFALRGQLLSCN